MFRGGANKLRQLVGAVDQIRFIEHAFRQAPEEPRHAVFQNLAARAEQVRIGCQRPAEFDEVVFVSAGAVQQKQGGRGGDIGSGNEAVDEISERCS